MFCAMLIAAGSHFSFAGEWSVSHFLSYGAFFDLTGNTLKPASGQTNALGFGIAQYGFWDEKPAGIFFHAGGLVPVTAALEPGVKNYISVMLEIMAGPGFKRFLSDTWIAEYGGGLAVTMEGAEYYVPGGKEKYETGSVNFGVGGSALMKLPLMGSLYFLLGANLLWTFINWTVIEAPDAESRQRWNLNTIAGVQPFIGIGLGVYSENRGHTARLGKLNYKP
jgi:hypothetical protein